METRNAQNYFGDEFGRGWQHSTEKSFGLLFEFDDLLCNSLEAFLKKSSQKLWWEKTFLRHDLELSVGLWSLNVYSSTPHPRPPTPKKLFVWIPAEKVTNTFLGLLLDSTAEILIFLRNLTLPWWKWCNWNILNASEVRGSISIAGHDRNIWNNFICFSQAFLFVNIWEIISK